MDDIKRPAAKLTVRQARAAYEAVCLKYGELPAPGVYEQGGVTPWPTGPVLVRDFEGLYGDYRWAVLWEGGPEEWTSECGYGGDGKPVYPVGVFTEAINGYALALYPA